MTPVPDFAGLFVDAAFDPHHGQAWPGEPLSVPSHGTSCAGGIPNASARARIVRSEDNERCPFSMCDRYDTEKPALEASIDSDQPRRRRAARAARPGELAATSEALSTRVEREHAPQTVCRLYRLSGTPQPAHNRGTAGLITAAEWVAALLAAGTSGCLRCVDTCQTAPSAGDGVCHRARRQGALGVAASATDRAATPELGACLDKTRLSQR
jgi:hypothetical protein